MTFAYDPETQAAVEISTGAILREHGNRGLLLEIGQCRAEYEEEDLRFGFHYYRDYVHIRFENRQGRLIETNIDNRATIPAREAIGAYVRAYEQLHHQSPTDHQINELCERLKSGVIALMRGSGNWDQYINEWEVTFGTSDGDLLRSRVAAWEKETGRQFWS